MENLIKCVLIRGKTSSFAREKQKHNKKPMPGQVGNAAAQTDVDVIFVTLQARKMHVSL